MLSLLVTPLGNVRAQSPENLSKENLIELEEIMTDKSLLNESKPGSIVDENLVNIDDDISPQFISLTAFKLKIDSLFGGITGSWKFTSKDIITYVDVTMTLQYKENW